MEWVLTARSTRFNIPSVSVLQMSTELSMRPPPGMHITKSMARVDLAFDVQQIPVYTSVGYLTWGRNLIIKSFYAFSRTSFSRCTHRDLWYVIEYANLVCKTDIVLAGERHCLVEHSGIREPMSVFISFARYCTHWTLFVTLVQAGCLFCSRRAQSYLVRTLQLLLQVRQSIHLSCDDRH